MKSSSIHRNALPTNAEEQLKVQKVEEGMMKLLPLVGEKTEQTLDLETSDCPNAEKCPKKSLILSYLDTQHMTPQKIFKGVIVGFFLLI